MRMTHTTTRRYPAAKAARLAFFVFLGALGVLCGIAVPAHADGIALVIGIDEYENLGKLKVCGNDARAMAAALVAGGRFRRERVILMTDGEEDASLRPTLARMRHRIELMCDLASTEDTLVLFFSGHGTTVTVKEGEKEKEEGYLIPLDGDRPKGDPDDANRAVPMAWIRERLQGSGAQRKLLILDACHADSGDKGVGGVAPALASTAIVLLSCDRDQVSYPHETEEQSVFTRFLLDGLGGPADRDGNGEVSVEELFAYVKTKMVDWCLRTGKKQTPTLDDDGKTGLILARRSFESAVSSDVDETRFREAEKLLDSLEAELPRGGN